MRLRTLKKWSKLAAPILEKHYGRKIFLAEKGAAYHESNVTCGCPKRLLERSLYGCNHQWHPLKGTPMVGEMSGYEEPEWSERTAWEELEKCVYWAERPPTMTDAEWAEAIKIARCLPATDEDLEQLAGGYMDAIDRLAETTKQMTASYAELNAALSSLGERTKELML